MNSLIHRGPDDWGIWVHPQQPVYLGHRRLSILDLSASGRQPMHSHNGRWVITYNGEIYNWLDLRKELEGLGVAFRSRTDTEVLLEAINVWGLEKALQKSVGMFAFALWDNKEQRLFIARDRIGEKPIYYAWTQKGWLVASELKAFHHFPFFDDTIDDTAVQYYLQYKYVPQPLTIYKSAKKLSPGCYAELQRDGQARLQPYWDFKQVVENGIQHPFSGSEDEAVEHLEALLTQSVNNQKIADVPVGAFLSGGIDSSLVVAMMQKTGATPVHTFSIGFDEDGYDESKYAKAVARHLATHHTDLIVTSKEAQSVIPELPAIYDEPFSDSSAIPTLLVSRLARQNVTVVLSGDAGDELFGGYNRYHQQVELWDKINRYPRWALNAGSHLYYQLSRFSAALGLDRYAYAFYCRHCHAESSRCPKTLYWGMLNNFRITDQFIKHPCPLNHSDGFPSVQSLYHYGMAVDTTHYLPDDILVKVDRAAMSCSLETRIPLLDHRIIEWAWTLPESYKIDSSQTKKILRRLLFKHVPRKLVERPKMGFGIPIGEWLRGPLKEWADDLLSTNRLSENKYLHPRKVHALWKAHRDGKANEQYILWSLLMLQAWIQENRVSQS